LKDTGSKKTKKPDKELKNSEEILIHRHKRGHKKRPKNYCSVVTFGGKRPNPRYRPRPISRNKKNSRDEFNEGEVNERKKVKSSFGCLFFVKSFIFLKKTVALRTKRV